MSEYKCIFYENRTCHVREHIDITDEDLKTGKTVSEDWDHNVMRDIQDVPEERLKRKHARNTADWLVGEFCRICPHLRG